MWVHLFTTKLSILYVYIASVAYTQFRGRVKLKFSRQLGDHSTLMAPINALMYLFSSVPNQPFIPLSHFPELAILRDNWLTIRTEAQKLIAQNHIKISEKNDDVGFNSFFKRGWKRFYLKWYEQPLPSACSLCPETVALLNSIPNIKGAMFALLPKQGQLKPHRDPYAGSLRYHLGLITPNSEKCCIYVDGTPYHWQDGEDVLFDETYIHSAKNETDIDRIILFCDVERPVRNKLVKMINHYFAKYVLAAATTGNLPTDRVGLLNKIYGYYQPLRIRANYLKKKNKFVYRLLQYTFLLSFIYWFFA